MLGFAGTDYEKVRMDFRTVTDPYSGNEIFVVPAIRPDWAIIHAMQADEKGNVICSSLESDRLAVLAARQAIVTVEKVVPEESLLARPGEIFLSALHIDLVVVAPRGAHPAGCVHGYETDRAHVAEYLAAAKTPEGFSAYLSRYVLGKTEEEYLGLVLGKAV